MKKPILVILVILLNFGNVINAATTDFTRFDLAYFKQAGITTTVIDSSPGKENSVNINVKVVNRCVEKIIITTECLENKEDLNIFIFSTGTRSGDCE